jgi:tetratricopeptide (TPR) repeat protein
VLCRVWTQNKPHLFWQPFIPPKSPPDNIQDEPLRVEARHHPFLSSPNTQQHPRVVVCTLQASQVETERKLQFYKHQDKPCFYVGQGNPDQAKYKQGVNRRMYTREEREDAAKAAFGEGKFSKALSEFVRAAELCIVRPSSDDAAERGADDGDASDAAAAGEAPPVIFATGIHTLFGNIAAVLTKLGRFEEAVAAADHAMFLNPEWAKGYFRKGAALFALGQAHDAVAAYDAGLAVEPDNDDLKQGRKLAASEAKAGEGKKEQRGPAAGAAGASGGGDAGKEKETEETEEAEETEGTEEKEETAEEAPEKELTESEVYALKLEDFLEITFPSVVKAALKRKREEDERAEQLLADGSELSKTMAFGLKKNPQGDRWEDFFCEQRVR